MISLLFYPILLHCVVLFCIVLSNIMLYYNIVYYVVSYYVLLSSTDGNSDAAGRWPQASPLPLRAQLLQTVTVRDGVSQQHHRDECQRDDSGKARESCAFSLRQRILHEQLRLSWEACLIQAGLVRLAQREIIESMIVSIIDESDYRIKDRPSNIVASKSALLS